MPSVPDSVSSVANLVIAAVGVGMLALPRAVAQGGWIGAGVLMLVAWMVAAATAMMQVRHSEGGERRAGDDADREKARGTLRDRENLFPTPCN